MFLKIMSKLMFKIVADNYGFNFKRFKIGVTDYDFDDDTLIWTFFLKNVLDRYFLKMYYFGTKR